MSLASLTAADVLSVVRLNPMTSDNPYSSPQQSNRPANPSLLLWTIGAVFGSAFVGGTIGLGLGAALGTFSPGYYRSVFSIGDSRNFDPLAVGIGHGLTLGVVFGAIVGLTSCRDVLLVPFTVANLTMGPVV